MKLYFSPGVCSLSPHIALREAGLDAELIRVDLATHTLDDGSDFHAVNPRGYVPILVLDDGQQLSEGPAIVQYIADRAPHARLAPPAGTMARYRLQEWLGFVSSELHKALAPLFDPATPEAVRQAVRDKVARRLDWTAAQFDGRRFVLGEEFSVADGYLYTILGWLRPLGMSLADWPALADFHRRVGERPAVRAALRAEGLLR